MVVWMVSFYLHGQDLDAIQTQKERHKRTFKQTQKTFKNCFDATEIRT